MAKIGKTLITGGTSGIGAAIVERFADETEVVFLGRNIEKGNKLSDQLKLQGKKVFFLNCDVTKKDEVEQAYEKAREILGEIDVLINNAGIATIGKVDTLTEEEWDDLFLTNVKSCYLFSKLAIPYMVEQKSGTIINIASTAGLVGAWGLHGYSATKGAVIQLTKSMAADYASLGVRVNCLCPGATETPMLEYLGEQNMNDFIDLIPIKRLAKPSEMANIAYFMASDEAKYMCGSIVVADGGFTAI